MTADFLDGWGWWLARRAWVVLACAAVVTAGQAQDGERPVPRIDRKAELKETLSSSGQFLARGGSQAERAVLVMRADEVLEEVTRLIDRQERRGEAYDRQMPRLRDPRPPVMIHLWLQPEAKSPVQPRLYHVEGVPQPVLGVVVDRADSAHHEDFRRQVVRLLLVERVVRGQPEAAGAGRGSIVPAWLEAGVLEALNFVRAGRPSERFASMFAQGRILSVEDILTAEPSELEAGARGAFSVSACCLVLMLLDQPDGPERFRSFLEAMPGRTGGWQDLLVRQFPGMALSPHSLEKWWALQAVALATPDMLEPMTAAETDRLLDAALIVRHRPAGEAKSGASSVVKWIRNWLPGRSTAADAATAAAATTGAAATGVVEEEVIPLSEIDRIVALPRRADVLRANQAALAALLLRACPLHRPIIEEYQAVLGRLSLGKTTGLADRCEDLGRRRREVLATAEATNDFLNWYEATQRGTRSGAFDTYFRLLESPAPRVRRGALDDPIARSLDQLEEEFSVP